VRIPALSEGARKYNKVCPAYLCIRDGYVLGDNGGNDAWVVPAVSIPPTWHRPCYKLRAISYNRERFDKRCNLYDFDIAIGDVSREGGFFISRRVFYFPQAIICVFAW